VPGESPHNLAQAILSLADDADMRTTLGRRARQRIESSLAWEHQAANLIEVYRDVLSTKLPTAALKKS
jgi:glycosyltransferase involved in cell wall biosynthesis